MTKILTLKEVSEMTRTPLPTLRYYRHMGTGPKSFLLGARVAYKLTDVEAWIEEQYNTEGGSGELAAAGK